MNFRTTIAVTCKDCLLASATVTVCNELPALRKINSFLYPEDGGSSLRETAARLTYNKSTHSTEHPKSYTVLFSRHYIYIVRVVKSRRMRWAGHVARMGEDGGVHRVLVGKPEGKRPLGRPRRRWEDNIKMDLQEV